MNRSRLIVVEGVLDAGETTTSGFVEDRRAVELPLLFRLPAQTLVFDVSDFDWRRCRREVKAFVERMVRV